VRCKNAESKKNNTKTFTAELRGKFKDDPAFQIYLK
jgi:hypothetical protein